MANLDRDGDVFVLNLGDGENRVNPVWSAEVVELLDEVAAAEGSKALVTTATGKFFSNGLDTGWNGGGDEAFATVRAAAAPVLLRVLTMPAPTVAAIQGHAFAAGGLLTLAHDFRIMRSDRGFWCLPEIDLRLVFPPSSIALAQAKLPPALLRDAVLTGRRWGGEQAVVAGIVDEAVSEADLLPRAVELAAGMANKADPVMGAIKRRMYREVVGHLEAAAD